MQKCSTLNKRDSASHQICATYGDDDDDKPEIYFCNGFFADIAARIL
jgi:hypothetical protein